MNSNDVQELIKEIEYEAQSSGEVGTGLCYQIIDALDDYVRMLKWQEQSQSMAPSDEPTGKRHKDL